MVAPLLRTLEDPGVGLSGTRIVDAKGQLVDAGVRLVLARFTLEGFAVMPPEHDAKTAGSGSVECDLVHPACFVTPLDLFTELGALDEQLGAERAVHDYALRVRERGLRVVCLTSVTMVHSPSAWREPDAGRARRRFADRWRERLVLSTSTDLRVRGIQAVAREWFADGNEARRGFTQLPQIAILVHGEAPPDPDAFLGTLLDTRVRPSRILWAAGGKAPSEVEDVSDASAAARELTEFRADRYVAFVRTDTSLVRDWLAELADAVEFSSTTLAATIAPEHAGSEMPIAADARCTLVSMRLMPQHVRIDAALPLDDALGDWIARGVRMDRDVRRIRGSAIAVGPPAPDGGFSSRWSAPLDLYRSRSLHTIVDVRPAAPSLSSIVTLSWNAPLYTELAIESIKNVTRSPYEIIIIDNGSDEETRRRLGAIEGVRVIYNDINTGFAHGCNQGIAAARGDHVVLLNNDVIVTDGWLEALLDVQRKHPAVGITAPRSNKIAGTQQIDDVPYTNLLLMRFFAADRDERLRGRWNRTGRVIGFCMCIAREVIDEIGGLDTRYGLGNFEDDDFCLRSRAAGYEIGVCEDSFIHHFGSISFKTNKLDFEGTMQANAKIFFERWGFPLNTERSYVPVAAVNRGFDRAEHYIPLPPPGLGVRKAGAGFVFA